MGRHFIPSSELAISPTSTQFSKPSSQCVEFRPHEIRCAPFHHSIQRFSRRVMRAWWSSRSSKPLPRHSVSGGRFDSYPLRQFVLNLGVSSLNPANGGDCVCHASEFAS